MATKSIELIGSPGIIRDIPPHKLTDNAFSDGNNVSFDDEGAESLSGDLETFKVAPIDPLWLHAFPPIGSPNWVYTDLTKAYVFDGSSHIEITRESGDYGAIPTERWQATVLNGVAVLNNTQDIPQAWSSFDTSVKLIDLPNWDVTRRAKVIRAFKNFLIALNLTDSGIHRPYRVLWSDSAVPGTLPGSWDSTDPATDSREFDLAETEDHIVDCLPMGDVNVIYKETSTWGMAYIGPPFFFRFWNILPNYGLLARDCVVASPLGHVVVTQDDIILHRGQQGSQQSLLDHSNRRLIFSQIDPDNFANSFLVSNVRGNKVHFFYPQLGDVYPTKIFTWNWGNKSVSFRDVPPTPFATYGPMGSSLAIDEEWG